MPCWCCCKRALERPPCTWESVPVKLNVKKKLIKIVQDTQQQIKNRCTTVLVYKWGIHFLLLLFKPICFREKKIHECLCMIALWQNCLKLFFPLSQTGLLKSTMTSSDFSPTKLITLFLFQTSASVARWFLRRFKFLVTVFYLYCSFYAFENHVRSLVNEITSLKKS